MQAMSTLRRTGRRERCTKVVSGDLVNGVGIYKVEVVRFLVNGETETSGLVAEGAVASRGLEGLDGRKGDGALDLFAVAGNNNIVYFSFRF